MAKIYCEAGKSLQQFGGECPDGWLEMKEERPEGNVVAVDSGEGIGIWVEVVKTYAELRKEEYPSLGEQFDMQYHDIENGTTVWKDTIAAIKAKYPKP